MSNDEQRKPITLCVKRHEWKALSPGAQRALTEMTGAAARQIRLQQAAEAERIRSVPLVAGQSQ